MVLVACTSKPQATFKGVDLTQPYSTVKMKLESCGCDFTVKDNNWGNNYDGYLFNASLYDKDCDCHVIEVNDTLFCLDVCFPERNFDDEELSLLYQQVMSDLTAQYGEAIPHTTHYGEDSEVAKVNERLGIPFKEYDYTEYVFETKNGYVSVPSRSSTGDKSVLIHYTPHYHYIFN